jgi:hypothetical protein
MSLTVRWAPADGPPAASTVRLPAAGPGCLARLVDAVRDAFAPGLDGKVRQCGRAFFLLLFFSAERARRGDGIGPRIRRSRALSTPHLPSHTSSKHAQAFTLTDLARDVATDEDVAALADRVSASARAGAAGASAVTLWVADGPGGRLAVPVKVRAVCACG